MKLPRVTYLMEHGIAILLVAWGQGDPPPPNSDT